MGFFLDKWPDYTQVCVTNRQRISQHSWLLRCGGVVTMKKDVFHFGLTLGNALIVVVFVNLISRLYTATILLGGLVDAVKFRVFDLEDKILIGSGVIGLITSVFFLYIVFQKGTSKYFFTWLAISLLNDAITWGDAIYDLCQIFKAVHPWFYLTLWKFLGVIVFDFYIYMVVIQFIRALNNVRNRHDEKLHPVGSGVETVFKYFEDSPHFGSQVLLVTDLVWSLASLQQFGLLALILGEQNLEPGDRFPYLNPRIILLEESVGRLVRVFMNLCGLFFLTKRNPKLVKLWVVIHTMLILVSTGSYFSLFRTASDVSLSTHLYELRLICDLFFRIIILRYMLKSDVSYESMILLLP